MGRKGPFPHNGILSSRLLIITSHFRTAPNWVEEKLQDGRFGTVKISIVSYMFNVIPTKNLNRFIFPKIDKLILKFVRKGKRSRITKVNLKGKAEGHRVSDIRTYCKDTVIQTRSYWCFDRKTDYRTRKSRNSPTYTVTWFMIKVTLQCSGKGLKNRQYNGSNKGCISFNGESSWKHSPYS